MKDAQEVAVMKRTIEMLRTGSLKPDVCENTRRKLCDYTANVNTFISPDESLKAAFEDLHQEPSFYTTVRIRMLE